MNFKRPIAALAAGTLLFTGVGALAAPQAASGGTTVRTDAEVQFRAGVDDRIFDPESPTLAGNDYRVILPEDGAMGATETDGGDVISFRLAFVPDLYFGIQNVSTTVQTVPARALRATYDGVAQWYQNFAQVTDLRGTATGWNLTVEMTQPFRLLDGNAVATGAGAHHINGARIHFRQGSHHTVSPDGNLVTAPVAVQPTFTLEYDSALSGAHTIMSAPAQNGMGFHTIRWGMQGASRANINEIPDQSALLAGAEEFHIVGTGATNSPINLVIPGNSMRAGRYRAELTWSLQDGPANIGLVTP